jgi:hypothetical protein
LPTLGRAIRDGTPVTPRNIFAAADLVKNDKAEIFRDRWGYLRVRAV